MSKPILGYWKIRGLAQPIRLLLVYAGQDFEDKYYECGPGPEFNRDCWFNDKFNLGLDFPNLPYYIDGNVMLSQSVTIMRYLARKHGLGAETDSEHMRLDLALDEAVDLKRDATGVCYSKIFESLKSGLMERVEIKLKEADKFLGSNQWFAGDRLTFVDFYWYELLELLDTIDPALLNSCSNLSSFRKRFQALPAIKQYMQSEKFLSHPFNNKMATFGNI